MSAPFDYAPLRQTALDLIAKFGRDVNLRHSTLTDITGVKAAFVDEELNVQTPAATRRRRAGGTQEIQGIYLVGDVGVDLDESWFVDDGGMRVDIVRNRPVKPGGTLLLHRLFAAA